MGNKGRRPNIVFVLTDDQGYGDLGCHGNPYLRTPHLDGLHAESVRLTNYHVGPTCSPTRAGLWTGHFHNSTGVWHTIAGRSLLRRDERTLADYLSAAGYATGLFGKWHLGDVYPYRPQDRGFTEVVTHGGGGVGNAQDYWGNNYEDDSYCRDGAWERFDGYCTDVWFRLGLEFIKRHRDEPFFCLISTNAPHSPHIVPERYSRPYVELAHSDPDAARFFNYPASDQMPKFYGMVSCIDENVGALRRRLGELGLAENTIFIFMTDNGSAGGLQRNREQFITAGFNAGMRGGKGTPYEGGHRVPFFLHWPAGGLSSGRDVSTLTANVDITPTLLDLCSVPLDETAFHGRTLTPLLKRAQGSGFNAQGSAAGEDEWPARALVTDSQRLLNPLKWRHSCVMRQEGQHEWRLINGRMLFDLATDPGQREDVAVQHPEVVERLRQDYEAWWDLVSGRMGESIPFSLGERSETVVLTSHDWRRAPESGQAIGIEDAGDDARCVWNQCLVRQGPEHGGYWEVEVARAGQYRLELRRWPREASLALAQGIPGELKPYSDAIARENGGYGGGKAIRIARAAVSVAFAKHEPVGAEASVDPGAPAAVFELELPAGAAQLEASFTTAEGATLGAYYVYVERGTS